MPERTVKTKLILEGGEQYRSEVQAICTDLKRLGRHTEDVNKSIAQLNKSLRELAELRKQTI